MIGSGDKLRNVLSIGTSFCFPLCAPTIEQLQALMSELLEEPERICSVPVVAVSVEYDGGVVSNTPAAEKLLHAFLVDKVAADRVLYINMPVQLHSPWDMTNFIEKDILVGLN